MVVAIDAMAKRYGKLPSEILANASTLDLVVLDAAITFENYIQEKEKAKAGGTLSAPNVSEDELMRIWKQANGENDLKQN